MQLIKYVKATGKLDSFFMADTTELLEAQRQDDDAIYGYLTVDPAIPPEHHDRHEVREGAIAAKTQLRLEADPLTIHADGVDECIVAVEPWRACAVLVNGEPFVLTEDDPYLSLTSDIPKMFVLTLDMPGYWAMPVIVHAQEEG